MQYRTNVVNLSLNFLTTNSELTQELFTLVALLDSAPFVVESVTLTLAKLLNIFFLTCPITNVVHEQLDEAVFRSRHVSLLNKKLNWLGCQKSDNNIIF